MYMKQGYVFAFGRYLCISEGIYLAISVEIDYCICGKSCSRMSHNLPSIPREKNNHFKMLFACERDMRGISDL